MQPSSGRPGLVQRFVRWNQQRAKSQPDMVLDKTPDGSSQAVENPTVDNPASDSDIDQPRNRPGSRQRSPFKRRRSWRWTLLCLAVLGVISGMGSAALLWLVSLPPPPDCKASATLLDIEQLYCAQQAVQSGDLPELIAGLELLQRWTPDDPLYAETQKLAEDWSKQVLSIAREKVSQSDLKGALEAVSHIPKTTPVYQDAQEFVTYWQKQWKEGEAIESKAQLALKQQNWTVASELVAALADFSNPYWNTQRANALAQQIGAEKQARQVLARARDAALGGQPAQLGQAIALAQEIPLKTYAWQDGRQDLRKWSQTLLAIGFQRWEAGDRTGALAALESASTSTTIPELQDLAAFSSVYRLLFNSLPSQQPSHSWFPSGQQVWQMMEAIAALGKIKPDSPFYQKAQEIQKNLQAQSDDLVQLYYAALTAELGQKSTIDLAIDQARQVTVDRPRRVQAQTLIAYWYDEIERLEDQPYLDRAITLAKSGKIPDLQAAITEASLIAQGRALRLEAQGRIAAWRDQIETIEDQPALDRAWAYANAGNLSEAITSAELIRPGRALYNQAQSAIYSWQAQLIRERQIAEDRPILDRAKAIANSGALYSAIQVASQITSGRVLYGEAQGLISSWNYQLNPPQPQPDALEPNKPDFPDEKSPERLEEPVRSPGIFVWPDGSLTPYSPSPGPAPVPLSPPSSPAPTPAPDNRSPILPSATPEVLTPTPAPPAAVSPIPPAPLDAPVSVPSPSTSAPENRTLDGRQETGEF